MESRGTRFFPLSFLLLGQHYLQQYSHVAKYTIIALQLYNINVGAQLAQLVIISVAGC